MALVLASALLSEAGFDHGFTTKDAGNFARGQDPLPRPMLLLNQVHSTIVRVVHGVSARDLEQAPPANASQRLARERPGEALAEQDGDALVADTPGITVGIRVADCVPVLIVDPLSQRVAAVHAGWRGVAGHIVRGALRAFGKDAAERVRVALGPSIGPCCFEVGAEVSEALATSSGPACVRSRQHDKAHVDLRTALETQLLCLGVDAARVERVGGCSFCDELGFHSYRRDGADSGRMLGFVAVPATVATRPQLDS